MPGGLMMFLFSSVGARITAVRGPRASLVTGIAIMAMGYFVIILLRTQWWEISLAWAITGAGVGVAYAAMPALIMSAVPVTETAAANGLNALMRSVGTALSSAVVAAVLAHETMHVGGGVLPTEHGFTSALVVSLSGCVVALVLALLIPVKRAGVTRQPGPTEGAQQLAGSG
jgi:MFS family permease